MEEDDKFRYAIWGENDASERLYNYLKTNYKNAEFVAFYDSYKMITYHGIKAQHPRQIKNDDVFVFVTGYTATDAAREMFQNMNRSEDSYYLLEVWLEVISTCTSVKTFRFHVPNVEELIRGTKIYEKNKTNTYLFNIKWVRGINVYSVK